MQVGGGKNLTNPIHSNTAKMILNEKNIKITKRKHYFKGFGSTYNVYISKSFNPEVQLKDAECAIKNKFENLWSELRGFKSMARLALVFKKIESKNKMAIFIQARKKS